MNKVTLVVAAIGCMLPTAYSRSASSIPNPLGQNGSSNLHHVELYDCSPCSKGGPCPKVCAGAHPAKPNPGSKNTHGCACLHNETGRPINFRYHWGKKDWNKVSMKPGWQYSICWKYADSSHSSPPLQFELDVDMSKGNAWKTYDIGRVQAPSDACSDVGSDAHYTVKHQPNTNNQYIAVYKRKS